MAQTIRLCLLLLAISSIDMTMEKHKVMNPGTPQIKRKNTEMNTYLQGHDSEDLQHNSTPGL
eukprot:2564988-Amphidinium_carterae.1